MQGKAIHCTARSNIAHNFVGLKEGYVYSIKNFIVQQNKDEYRIIRQDPFMIEFDGSTRTRKVSVNTDGFNRYPFDTDLYTYLCRGQFTVIIPFFRGLNNDKYCVANNAEWRKRTILIKLTNKISQVN